MASTNTINSTRIELLTKHNYDTWVIQVEALLVKHDSWPYVSGECQKPVVTGEDQELVVAQDTLAQWKIQDRKAKSDLILSISPTELKHIRNCDTSKEVWDRLRSVYASQGPMRKATLLEQLLLKRMNENDDVRDYLSRFMDTVDKLSNMEIEINGDLLSIMLLHSLPSSFDNFCCAIKSRDNLPDIDTLMTKIVEEYDSKIHKSNDSGSSAMLSKHQLRTAKSIVARPRDTKVPVNPPNYRCHYCNRKGHKSAECFKRKRDAEKANITADIFYANEAGNATTVEACSHTASRKWCLDSGCTSHLCKDLRLFMKPHETASGINLATDTTAQATAKGDIKLIASNGKHDREITLANALYVPNLRTNLVSIAKVVDKDHEVLFNKKHAYIRDANGVVKMVADREGDLFYLKEGHSSTAMTTSSSTSNAEEWHRRLGHLNWNDMSFMQRNKMASGLTFKSEGTLPPCSVCAIGKLTRLPFREPGKRSSSLLEIVHTDICGPMRTTSQGGARYLLTFIDDYSRWTVVYFLKDKSETTSKFLQYKSYAETQTGRKIRALQSDNGGEFCNSTMDRILSEAGIRRRLSTPHTPQQNGVAERKNRTLVEAARCMLAESGLPVSFWAEAVATANHVRNRCTTRILSTKTPFEMWTGRRPNVSYLQRFGAKAYILNKSPAKGKFSPRGIEGTLVGYSQTRKAYRFWVSSDRKIHETRDVKFFSAYQSKDEHHSPIQGTSGKHFSVSDGWQKLQDADETEIGANLPSNPDGERVDEEIPAEPGDRIAIQDDASCERPAADAIRQRRGPGRPRKILTGKPGRPIKEYNMVPVTVEGHESANSAEIDNDNDDESLLWENAGSAFGVCEIPFHKAITGPDKDEWFDAVYSEIRSLIVNDTFDIVPRPENNKIIKCRIVLRNKFNADGTLARRKARVVAKGYAQRPGIDFHKTYAPVARLSSMRLLVALAAKFNLNISQLDVETAYLNGKVDTDIYMELPDSLQDTLERIACQEKDTTLLRRARTLLNKVSMPGMVCKLNKALYGLRQAGRQWHAKLSEVLRSIGLVPTNADPSVYVGNDKLTFVLVYVDDILIFSNNPDEERRIKDELIRSFKIKDLGTARQCLGIEIRRHRGAICLSQRGYVKEILKRFGMSECKPVSTPLVVGAKLTKASNTERSDEADYPYQELVGALMYAAMGTRPDIAHAVSALSQFNTCYNKEHWAAAKRVLRYLQGTLNYELVYRMDEKPLRGFVDADWGNCPIDRRSYTGCIFLLSGAAVTWESRKQRTVALSSTEAEYMAITDAAKEAIYIVNFLKELGCKNLIDVAIYNDNHSAGHLADNPISHARSKHIDIRHHFIRQVLKEGTLKLIYLPTEEMAADVLTKALPGTKHSRCLDGLGLQSNLKSSDTT